MERIGRMELLMNRASAAVTGLSAALDGYVEALEAISALSDYYGSEAWRQDRADDEAGRLPAGMRRGVLSEDGLWNLLSDNRQLLSELEDLLCSLIPPPEE